MTRTLTDEHRQKLAEAAKRRYASSQTRKEQSERMKAVYVASPSLRKMHDATAIAKRSSSMKEKWQTEYRGKVLAARSTTEHRQLKSSQTKQQWQQSRDRLIESFKQSKRQHMTSENSKNLDNKEWLEEQNKTLTITEIANNLGCAQSTVSTAFKDHGIIPAVHRVDYMGGQNEIAEYIESLGLTVSRNNRKVIAPFEIDTYVETAKVGIEYHGSYWHSYDRPETHKEKSRHLFKSLACDAVGVRLIQVYDYEWQTKRDICKGIIANALGVTTKVMARSCDVCIPTPDEVTTFLRDNHIQGSVAYKIAVGLKQNGELIAVMTLGKSRFGSTWELLRLCTKVGVAIVGGAAKMWSHAQPLLPAGVVVKSYSNRRLFGGGVYKQLGFVEERTTLGYVYWQQGRVFSRLKFQKHRLPKMLATFDPLLTEAENMFANGYRRLWDAGQTAWLYTPTSAID